MSSENPEQGEAPKYKYTITLVHNPPDVIKRIIENTAAAINKYLMDEARRDEAPKAKPPQVRECDLVMKGGITSGIVYPPLAIKLHDAGYSFRNVGGTSAGAIAAAVTAAAERGEKQGGFKKLEEIRKWLGEDKNLLNLFQPARSTAPVLRTFLVYPKLQWLRLFPLKLVVALLAGDTLFFIAGAILGAGLAYLFAWLVAGSLRGWGVVLLVLLALAGALVTVAAHLYLVLTKSVPKNFFGICTGRGKDPARRDETALTDWLTVNLNDLAGMDTGTDARPLTFGDLWEWRPGEPEPAPAGSKRIDLRMMTSNLSQNRPYILPFDDVYLVKKEEFEKLFPPNVVRHMEEHKRKIPGFKPPEDYFLFPEAKDLPVVVATRMSLSFPVLISMIPLYTIGHDAFGGKRVRFELEPDPESGGASHIVLKESAGDGGWAKVRETQELEIADPERGLQRNWFSDGGICSNFPIHFFDSWLPTRPTFGVNLTSQMGDRPDTGDAAQAGGGDKGWQADPARFSYMAQQPILPDYAAPTAPVSYNTDVYLPQPGSEAAPEWTPVPDLPKFLSSIFRTAQNYRDNMQAMLPSYYERIVQIRLSDKEGGLNLEMPKEVIEHVVRKGEDAGDALTHDFNMSKHQWVRFRVLMGQMEKAMRAMKKALDDPGGGLPRPFDYPRLLEEQRDPSLKYPFVRDECWCDNAEVRLAAIGLAIDAWTPPDFSPEPPLPEPTLRVAPEI
ncbi:MAG TPA: patatin-like phospholipase family protein [Pyrinomonadaceae bacterium]|nr:patatin-like phospholipase family protein [Pyrinomonadaceae bacterium]